MVWVGLFWFGCVRIDLAWFVLAAYWQATYIQAPHKLCMESVQAPYSIGSVRIGRFGQAWCGRLWLWLWLRTGYVQAGLVWFGLVWFGLAWLYIGLAGNGREAEAEREGDEGEGREGGEGEGQIRGGEGGGGGGGWRGGMGRGRGGRGREKGDGEAEKEAERGWEGGYWGIKGCRKGGCRWIYFWLRMDVCIREFSPRLYSNYKYYYYAKERRRKDT